MCLIVCRIIRFRLADPLFVLLKQHDPEFKSLTFFQSSGAAEYMARRYESDSRC